ncbi:MAG: hypothetical protein VB142_10420 [Burkholderia sp.]
MQTLDQRCPKQYVYIFKCKQTPTHRLSNRWPPDQAARPTLCTPDLILTPESPCAVATIIHS